MLGFKNQVIGNYGMMVHVYFHELWFIVFASYLSNRKQFVKTYTCKSDKEYITCGILQGSVLGPTLFLMYINDLPDFHAMQTQLFADDTALLMSGPNILDLQNTINDEIKNVQKWFMQNKLTLNLNKTNYLLFHPAKEKQSHHFLKFWW